LGNWHLYSQDTQTYFCTRILCNYFFTFRFLLLQREKARESSLLTLSKPSVIWNLRKKTTFDWWLLIMKKSWWRSKKHFQILSKFYNFGVRFIKWRSLQFETVGISEPFQFRKGILAIQVDKENSRFFWFWRPFVFFLVVTFENHSNSKLNFDKDLRILARMTRICFLARTNPCQYKDMRCLETVKLST
jgi:hypothetical protein